MASVETLKKLNEKRGKLHADMKAIADKYGAKDAWTPEDNQAWDKLDAEYSENLKLLEAENAELSAEAKREEQNREKADRLRSLSDHNSKFDEIANRIGKDGASLTDGLHITGQGEVKDGPTERTRNLALQAWCAFGSAPHQLTDEHFAAAKQCKVRLDSNALDINLVRDYDAIRDAFLPGNHAWKPNSVFNTLTTHTGSSGGFTIGETFVANLEKAMLAFGGMFQVSQIIRTATGEPMRWPTADDTSNTGVQLGESQAVTTADPSFGQVLWNAYTFSSKEVKVPQELLEDSVFNLASEISMMLGERLGRVQNTKYTTGTGAGTAKGITVAAAAGVTTASSTAIAWDEVIDLEHTIDPSRRMMGNGYMMHDSILKLLRKLKDGNGQYLWNRGANGGAPDTINTYPYQVNQDMASSAASTNITMIFGQLSHYKIRQVNSVRVYRLTERHRENNQDAFLAFVRGDGNLLDAGDNPVKKMTQV